MLIFNLRPVQSNNCFWIRRIGSFWSRLKFKTASSRHQFTSSRFLAQRSKIVSRNWNWRSNRVQLHWPVGLSFVTISTQRIYFFFWMEVRIQSVLSWIVQNHWLLRCLFLNLSWFFDKMAKFTVVSPHVFLKFLNLPAIPLDFFFIDLMTVLQLTNHYSALLIWCINQFYQSTFGVAELNDSI